jgi:hypothetical protein
MTINYYPVVSIPYQSLPGGVTSYPGKPSNAPVQLPIKALDLKLLSQLNIYETYEKPIGSDWLSRMIEAVVEAGSNGETCIKDYQTISPGWKGMFSQEFGTAVSLAIATHREQFVFFVPLRLCAYKKSLRYMGRDKWPLYISHEVPHRWRVAKLNSAAYKKILMPDYVLMDWDSAGNPRFSTLEAKGRDKPIDTDNYAEYVGWKHQSQNARLVAARAGMQNAAPAFHRNILSVVAVRPKLSNVNDRKIQCRWFNHNNSENVNVPSRWAIELAALHYMFCLANLGFQYLSNALEVALVYGLAVERTEVGVRPLASYPGLRVRSTLRQAYTYAFLTEDTLGIVDLLIKYLSGGGPSADVVLAALRRHTTRNASEFFTGLEPSRVALLPSGVGLVRPR